ncbi:MAG: glutathione S-transferase N-terminal domain-containing protein [Pseudomonadota bacterium]
MTITLYAAPQSLYSGRARSYLIKAGLDYREQAFNTQHYRENVLPKAGGRQSLPTIEMEDGTVVRDGAAIIDYFEAQNGGAFSPRTPKQRVLSRLFDAIGAEGLLRPAMHYRWNFDDLNLEFLRFYFEALMPAGMRDRAEDVMNQMRRGGEAFGAVAETFELVESLYEAALERLNDHFGAQPYLLGGRPCIGDFGMIAPLYGHLGRDPKPLAMMQASAHELFRWVERMNRPEPDLFGFPDAEADYLPDDEIPETLIALLKQLAVDFVPETRAAAATINQWLADQADLEPGTTAERTVGFCSFEVDGVTVNAIAQPYRFFMLARVQAEVAGLADGDRTDVLALLEACGMSEVLAMTLTRPIGRSNNLEVWE